MAACCRCNRFSSCKNYACVKAGRLCLSCLPSGLGKIANSTGPIQGPTSHQGTRAAVSDISLSPPRGVVEEAVDVDVDEDTDSIAHEGELPPEWPLPPLQEHNFVWGSLEGVRFINVINMACEKVIYWPANLFLLPHGASGISFTSELSGLFLSFARCLQRGSSIYESCGCVSTPAFQRQVRPRIMSSICKGGWFSGKMVMWSLCYMKASVSEIKWSEIAL